jgi:CPA1 family monovalent cation:H+ antiporter
VTLQFLVIAVILAIGTLAGRWASSRTNLPDATIYVLLGIGAALVPGMTDVHVPPDVVLLVFLPPLLYYAAFYSDPRETLSHLTAILGQAVALVAVTAGSAAAVLILLFPDLSWAVALAFGAAIAPPDPVAAGSVLQRLGAPRRLVTVLESEGLINDGVALTLFAVAVSAVGVGTSPGSVLGTLALEVGGGVALGALVGWLGTMARARVCDVPSQVVLSLLVPFLAFVPADLLHASGVLATVTAAVWLGTRGRGLVEPTSRLHTETFWRVLNTLLVATLFLLLGLQVPRLVGAVESYPPGHLALAAAATVGTVVAVRLLWTLVLAPPAVTGARRLLGKGPSEQRLSWRERIVLGWCGPRGAVSLAVALSLPLTTADGAPFPRRDLLVFLTVVVVLVTLVGQVMPLAALLRWLELRPSRDEMTEVTRARRAMVDAALRRLDEMASSDEPAPNGVEEMRQMLELRRDHLRERHEGNSDDGSDRSGDASDLRLELLGVERDTLRRLLGEGAISRHAVVTISQELDLDETQLRSRA